MRTGRWTGSNRGTIKLLQDLFVERAVDWSKYVGHPARSQNAVNIWKYTWSRE